jgi:hypothetical protein
MAGRARAGHQGNAVILLGAIAEVLSGSRFDLVWAHKRGFPMPACRSLLAATAV